MEAQAFIWSIGRQKLQDGCCQQGSRLQCQQRKTQIPSLTVTQTTCVTALPHCVIG